MVRNKVEKRRPGLRGCIEEAGRKTGEGVNAGAKQVEGWVKDTGDGIKEVGENSKWTSDS